METAPSSVPSTSPSTSPSGTHSYLCPKCGSGELCGAITLEADLRIAEDGSVFLVEGDHQVRRVRLYCLEGCGELGTLELSDDDTPPASPPSPASHPDPMVESALWALSDFASSGIYIEEDKTAQSDEDLWDQCQSEEAGTPCT